MTNDEWASVYYEGRALHELRELQGLVNGPGAADPGKAVDDKVLKRAYLERVVNSTQPNGTCDITRKETDANPNRNELVAMAGTPLANGGEAGAQACPHDAFCENGHENVKDESPALHENGRLVPNYPSGPVEPPTVRTWRPTGPQGNASCDVRGGPELDCFSDRGRVDETWILCEKCVRWRRIKPQFIPEGPWHCWMNMDKR